MTKGHHTKQQAFALESARRLLKAIESVCHECAEKPTDWAVNASPSASSLCPGCQKVRALIEAYHSIAEDAPYVRNKNSAE